MRVSGDRFSISQLISSVTSNLSRVLREPQKDAEEKPSLETPLIPKSQDPSIPEGVQKDWLVITIEGGDNDLAKKLKEDVNDMEEVGSSENFHWVSLLDVGQGRLPDIKGVKAFYIKKDTVTQGPNDTTIRSPELMSLKRADLTDPKFLANFVVEVAKRFPAKHIMLIISSHGKGKDGVIKEEQPNGDGKYMSLSALRGALHQIEKELGRPIDVLGFDACLMGTLEVALAARGFVRYMVASEAPETDEGWPYKKIMGHMKGRSRLSPEELSRIIVDKASERSYIIPTLSAIDLAKVKPIYQALNELAIRLMFTNTPMRLLLSIARRTEKTDRYLQDYRDIYDFARRIYENHEINDLRLKKAAKKLMSAIDNAVLEEEHYNQLYPNAHGLSIYFPLDGRVDDRYKRLNPHLANWYRWLLKLNDYIYQEEKLKK